MITVWYRMLDGKTTSQDYRLSSTIINQAPGAVDHITASGLELNHIIQKFPGLVLPHDILYDTGSNEVQSVNISSSVIWYGDLAKFIIGNW